MSEQVTVKIAVAGFYCETNSFSDIRDPALSFVGADGVRGQHIGSAGAIAGYLEYERRHPEFALHLLGLARVGPGGALSDETLATIIDPLLRGFEHLASLDGVLLALHGSAMSQSRHDVDADLVAAVREIVGPDVPMGVTLDAHANVSSRLCAAANIVTAYKTTPHADQRERGFATAQLLSDAISRRISPMVSLVKVPILTGVLHHNTALGPMKEIMTAAKRLEHRPGVLSLDVALGTAFSDTPNLGMSVISVSDRDPDVGEVAACELAELIWAQRARLAAMPETTEEIVPRLRDEPDKRTLVVDLGDNVYGGAAGEGLTLFLALARAGLSGVVATVFSPRDVSRAIRSGIGGKLAISEADGDHVLQGRVSAVLYDDAGRSPRAAVVEVDDGNTLVLSMDRKLAGDPGQLLSSGIVRPHTRTLLAKGDHRTVLGLPEAIDRVLWVDTPGATPPQLSVLPYRNRPRPLFPLDSNDGWDRSDFRL